MIEFVSTNCQHQSYGLPESRAGSDGLPPVPSTPHPNSSASHSSCALSTGIGQSTTGSRRPFRTYVESAGLNGASQWSPH